ncbi:MAG: HAD family hydrolase [Deltaproteobacteria bacterium]|jgi:putative hydrolase of the HAD superfamily|nr:HAD family hydrolase [Deltaproteobacteria bacterium]
MLKNNLLSKYIKPIFPRPSSFHRSGKLEDKIRCILFDIYGTLFISDSGDIGIAKRQSYKSERLEKLLNKCGIQQTPSEILNRFFATIDNAHQTLKEKGVDFPEVEIDRIWMRVLEIDDLDIVRAFAMEFELIVNPVYPMPNLEKTLSACKDLDVLLGIISNAQFYTPYLFKWFLDSSPEDLGFHPDLIFYSYKFGYAKPSIFMFNVAAEELEKMGISTHSVLYIGNDMLNDIYPAKKAGFRTALFAGDARSLRLRENDPKCKDLSADIIVTDLIQILDHIQ